MKKDDEIAQGDPQIRKTWLVLGLLYVLFFLWLEPLIDWVMALSPPDMELAALTAYAERKAYITTLAFGLARSFPLLIFLWAGYQVLLAQRLPPKSWRLPISVRVMKGTQARTAGLTIIAFSLLLLFRELLLLINAKG